MSFHQSATTKNLFCRVDTAGVSSFSGCQCYAPLAGLVYDRKLEELSAPDVHAEQNDNHHHRRHKRYPVNCSVYLFCESELWRARKLEYIILDERQAVECGYFTLSFLHRRNSSIFRSAALSSLHFLIAVRSCLFITTLSP